MLKAITKWLRRRPLLMLKAPEPVESLLPSNLEAFYLATLDVVYDQAMSSVGFFMLIEEAMEYRLNDGEWHPNSTLEDNPIEYVLNKEFDRWMMLIDKNQDWFEGAQRQLLDIISSYVETHNLGSEHTGTKSDHIDKGSSKKFADLHRRIIWEVASGFCGDITIKRMTDDDLKGRKDGSMACIVTVEFQGQHWAFEALDGALYEQSTPSLNGEKVDLSDSSKIDKHCAGMIAKIAMHSVRAWRRTQRLVQLNDDPLFKSSAMQISRITGACYHEHLLEIPQFTAQDEFNRDYVAKFYSYEYEVYYPMFRLIERIYRNIYVEKNLKSWSISDEGE